MIMTEWKTYTLKELSKGRGEYGIGAPAVPFDKEKYTYLRITDINDDGTLNTSGMMSVDADDAEEYILEKNDIVFARTGNSTGRSYFYDGRDGELVYAGFLIRFRLDETKVNPKILKYYTHSKPYYDWVKSFDTGGTRGNINAKTYGDMPIYLPPRHIQDRIAGILGAIDDKIENNRRINTNLELQAQALYKQWFVDFEFPNEEGKPYKSSGGKMVDSELGQIPEGWRVQTISDISVRIASGGTPKSLNESYYNGEIKWFTTKELKDCFLIDSDKHISTEALNDSAAKLFPKNTILMAIYAAPTVGRLGILTAESTFNQAAVGIVAKEEIGHLFVYLTLLAERENLNNLASGAAQQNLNVGIVKQYKLIVPTKKLLIAFNQIAGSLFERIKVVSNENKTLATLRDTLLPKLMNGEIKTE